MRIEWLGRPRTCDRSRLLVLALFALMLGACSSSGPGSGDGSDVPSADAYQGDSGGTDAGDRDVDSVDASDDAPDADDDAPDVPDVDLDVVPDADDADAVDPDARDADDRDANDADVGDTDTGDVDSGDVADTDTDDADTGEVCDPECEDDGNPCTDVVCIAGECTTVNNTATCDDGDACTEGDVCAEGVCGGTPLVCEDTGDACTESVCVEGECRVSDISGGACDDGNACTFDDACFEGECVGGADVECPSSTCITGTCDPTVGCVEAPTDCSDGQTCTYDLCDEVAGCVNPDWAFCYPGTEFSFSDFLAPEAASIERRGLVTPSAEGMLLSDVPASQGAMWWPSRVNVSDGFRTTFSFDALHEFGDEGEGMAFVLQNVSLDEVGDGPRGLDESSMTIGIDTAREVIVLRYGDTTVTSARLAPVEDTGPHNVVVDYTPGWLTVTYDGYPVIALPVVLQAADAVDPSGASWVGFTARTSGSGGTKFWLRTWSFESRCQATPCDDGNLCTMDSCGEGECFYSGNVCDDGNACTVDSCEPSTGECLREPAPCDDGNACTTDVCDQGLGCVAVYEACDAPLWMPEIRPGRELVWSGDGTVVDGAAYATSSEIGQRGAIWVAERRNVRHDFYASVTMTLSESAVGGGDGFALVLQDVGTWLDWSADGWSPFGLAVYFDTHYDANDPGAVMLRVLQHGAALLTVSLPENTFADGTYTVDLRLEGGELSVSLDDDVLFERLPVDVAAIATEGRAWFGVMASTSVSRQAHAITGLSLNSGCELTCGGACDAPHAGPGCGDATVAACVCDADPACCSDSWGASCVALATGACAAECATCGDGHCDAASGERPTSCPADCGAPALCDGGTCDAPVEGACTVSACPAEPTCATGTAVNGACVFAVAGTFDRSGAASACGAAGGALLTPTDGWQNRQARAIADDVCGAVSAWLDATNDDAYRGWPGGTPDLGVGELTAMSSSGEWAGVPTSTPLSCALCALDQAPQVRACDEVPACADDVCTTTSCSDGVGCGVAAVDSACQGASIRGVEPVTEPLLPQADAAIEGYLQLEYDLAVQHVVGLRNAVERIGSIRTTYFAEDAAARSFSAQWRMSDLRPEPGASWIVSSRVHVSVLIGYGDVDAALAAYERTRTWSPATGDAGTLAVIPNNILSALWQFTRLGVSLRAAVQDASGLQWLDYRGTPVSEGPSATLCAPPLSHASMGARTPSPSWFDTDLVVRSTGDFSFVDNMFGEVADSFLRVADRTLPASVEQNLSIVRIDEVYHDFGLAGRITAHGEEHLAAVVETIASPEMQWNILTIFLADIGVFGFDALLARASAGGSRGSGHWLWRPQRAVEIGGAAMAEEEVEVCNGEGSLGTTSTSTRGVWRHALLAPAAGDVWTIGSAAAGVSCDPSVDGGAITLETRPPCMWTFPEIVSRAPGRVDCSTNTCTDDAACDDGSACTTDTCDGGTCRYDSIVCDDGDVCTTDTCDAASGCVFSVPLTCDDGNACTDGTCDPTLGCRFPSLDVACDDGNACTTGDACVDGVCVGVPQVCDDGNACTTGDVCLPGGCAGTQLACDDGDACTADTCSDGVCSSGFACDDGLPCTSDACTPVCAAGEYMDGGCYLAIEQPSGLAFAAGVDACGAAGAHLAVLSDADEAAAARGALTGACASSVALIGLDYRGWVTGEPVSFLGGLLEVPASGFVGVLNADGTLGVTGQATPVRCVLCEAPVVGSTCDSVSECADADACTTEVCTESGCAYPDVPCDDGNACTWDICDSESGCMHGGGDCNDDDPCTADFCDPEVGCSNTFCDDGNACTANVCDALGCSYPGGDCDDGNVCTVDACDPDVGCSNEPLNCDDGNPCTADSCDPVSGCRNEVVADETACDVSECTQEHCMAGTCVPYANELPALGCRGNIRGYNSDEWVLREDADFSGGDIVLNEWTATVDLGTAWFRDKFYMADDWGIFFGVVTDHPPLAQGNGVSVNIQREGTHITTGSWGANVGLAVSIIASYSDPRVIVKLNGGTIASAGLPIDLGADSLEGFVTIWGVRIADDVLTIRGPSSVTYDDRGVPSITYDDLVSFPDIDLVTMGVLDADGKAYVGFGADNDGAFIEGGHTLRGFAGDISHRCVRRPCTAVGDACAISGECVRSPSTARCDDYGMDAELVGSDRVCGTQLIDGECTFAATRNEAAAACRTIGARLCTLDEVRADEVSRAGCGFGSARVWTADGCDSRGGFWTAPARAEFLGVAPPLCAQQNDDYAVACCLDEDPDDTFSTCRFNRFENGCGDTDRCTVDTCDPDLGCANVAVDTCYNVQDGGCCEANGTAGCEESRCQTCVCAIDPSCCTEEWTEECAAITHERCWQACDYACGL